MCEHLHPLSGGQTDEQHAHFALNYMRALNVKSSMDHPILHTPFRENHQRQGISPDVATSS
jgi:hypothetical protein